MYKYILGMGLLCVSLKVNAQPQIPTFQSFQPVQMPGMAPQSNTPNYNPFNNSNYGGPRRTTADDVRRQQDPNYGYANDPKTNQQRNEAAAKERMANDPAYNPALRNGVNHNFPINQQKELHDLIENIVAQDDARYTTSGITPEDFKSPQFAAKTKSYTDALRILKNMLSGKAPINLADAYFAMESAYGEAYLSKVEFKAIVQQSADFIMRWMQQNKLNIYDNASINYAVQQFMGEKLQISAFKNKDGKPSIEVITHDHFRYDYNDFKGDKDHRNFFVTKCFATGTGQCNSLPAVYLILVEAVGGKAYLALAPQHSLIKYPDQKGNIRNYEPTSHWDITNEWYLDDMFISKLADQNNVYLNPWGGRQIVADIVLQLSFGYFRKFGGADGKFASECLKAAKPCFPKNNNLMVYFAISNQYGYELTQALRKSSIDRLSNIGQSPEAQAIFEKWQENEAIIERLGYQDEPRDMYEEMMKYHEFRGKMQEAASDDTKEKHSLFTKVQQSAK